MSWDGEGSDCISYRLRRAGRLVAKFYDDALKPCGLRNTQFTLLGALDHLGETSIGELSEALAIDGTTLTRNLDILVRRRLVLNGTEEDGRVRTVRLSAAGERAVDRAKPLWRKAQRQVIRAIGSDAWNDVRILLDEIEAECEPHD